MVSSGTGLPACDCSPSRTCLLFWRGMRMPPTHSNHNRLAALDAMAGSSCAPFSNATPPTHARVRTLCLHFSSLPSRASSTFSLAVFAGCRASRLSCLLPRPLLERYVSAGLRRLMDALWCRYLLEHTLHCTPSLCRPAQRTCSAGCDVGYYAHGVISNTALTSLARMCTHTQTHTLCTHAHTHAYQ